MWFKQLGLEGGVEVDTDLSAVCPMLSRLWFAPGLQRFSVVLVRIGCYHGRDVEGLVGPVRVGRTFLIMDNQIKRRIPAPELYLPGGQPFGRASSRAVARRVDRQADGVMGQAALAHVTDQARAVLTAGALHNIGALAGLAEQCAQVAPAGGPYYQAVLKAYGLSAARGVAEL